jgi:fatty acid-binding protein DegV
MDSAKSFLIPADFDYLRRGGRLSPLVSHVGKLAGLAPVMTQTDDGTRLTVASIKRGFKAAVKYCVEYLQKHGVGQGFKVYISHAAAPEKAEMALELLRAAMPDAEYEIVPLSPAFITQGGPKCMAIQYVEL